MSAHRTLAPLRQTRWRASTHSRLSLSLRREACFLVILWPTIGHRARSVRLSPSRRDFRYGLRNAEGRKEVKLEGKGEQEGGKSEAGSGFSCLLKHEIVAALFLISRLWVICTQLV